MVTIFSMIEDGFKKYSLNVSTISLKHQDKKFPIEFTIEFGLILFKKLLLSQNENIISCHFDI